MSTTFKPTINVPVRFAIQFADQVEGQYGPQLRLKGKPEASQEQVYVYLPVDCINALTQTGATAKQSDKGTSYGPIKAGLWTILKAQAAGEKYPTTTLTPPNGKIEVPAKNEVKHVEAGPGKPAQPVSDDADARLVAIWKDTLEEVMAATNGRLEDGAVMSGVSTLFIARSKLVVKGGW